MQKQKSIVRGAVAGIVGGLAASWIMNEFMTGLGPSLQKAVQSNGENQQPETHTGPEKRDATVETADAIAHAATGEHLSPEQQEKGGPIVHYAFGALSGGVYGALAEYSPTVRSGLGTSFGGVLFSAADLLAVPAFNLGPWPTDQPASAQATPFAAHIVYGVTTEVVRRLVRWIL